MHLRDLLDEVATGHEPPSRLSADEIFAAGVRRRRTTVTARIGTAAVLGVALVVALITFIAPARAPDPAGPGIGPGIVSVAGSDRDHLYALVRSCVMCDPELRVTADGGRTWTTHGTPADLDLLGPPYRVDVPRAGSVVMSGYGTVSGGPAQILFVSVDSGRTFAPVTAQDTPVDAAPPDALVSCAYNPSIVDRCVAVQVIDPDAGTAAPLAAQPDLVTVQAVRAPDGALWAVGRDDGVKRPAVATSTDGGRNWTSHVFTGAPEFSAEYRLLGADVSAIDGTVVVELTYAAFSNPSQSSNVAYRLRDGEWQRLDTAGLATAPMAMYPSYLTDDGTHVIQHVEYRASPHLSLPVLVESAGPAPTEPARTADIQFWGCGPGETTYRRIAAPAGLDGDVLSEVGPLRGGGYLAYSVDNIWVSADGRDWRRLKRG